MISVIIPTLDAEHCLAKCLSALVSGVVQGVVSEVIVVDGGSDDGTLAIADQAGAKIIKSEVGRGVQLVAGAREAQGRWLLFLHADTVLEAGWEQCAQSFIEKVEGEQRKDCACGFRFALDDDGISPRILESFVGLRAGLFGLPYGDQGLLISRALYDELGGYQPLVVMEDLDIVRRLGRRRISVLRSRAITSAVRYRRDGYLSRVVRNQVCLLMYALGYSPLKIAKVYRREMSRKP